MVEALVVPIKENSPARCVAVPLGEYDLRHLAAGRYKLGEKIGAGSFGEIHRGVSIVSGRKVAIKLENRHSSQQVLEDEYKIYKTLAGGLGIPKASWFGRQLDSNAMVLDMLGPSLQDLFGHCHHKFTLQTVLALGHQVLERIEYVHSHKYLHRDIKPENFLIGLGKHGQLVYMIDFGLSKRYADDQGLHIPQRYGQSLTGTARYSSIHNHLGLEQSRRDDLEGLAYMLIYFLQGSLPWQGITANTNLLKHGKILKSKYATTTDALCEGIPQEFGILLDYARELVFDQSPDYDFVHELLSNVPSRLGLLGGDVWDWNARQAKKPVPRLGSVATVHTYASSRTRARQQEV